MRINSRRMCFWLMMRAWYCTFALLATLLVSWLM